MLNRSFLIVLLALAGVACGPSRPPSPVAEPPEEAQVVTPEGELAGVPGRAPTASEGRAIAELLRVAERLRDLRFERPVPFRVQSREVITEFVRDKIDEDELERARIFYVALGLLAPDLDIRDLLIRVLGEQIVGYYDPERGLMVVREDVVAELASQERGRALGEAEMVIVHELVHALQDQRLALGERYEEERTIDGDNAFASLVEGDATLAMIGHMADQGGRSLSALTRNAGVLRTIVRSNPQAVAGQEIESAPPIVRLPLLSRYLDGMVFCATLHGQRGFLAIDEAHRRPPVSTEQILHPERYLAGEAPVSVTLPELPELTAAGLVAHEEETLGELEMSIFFAQGRPRGSAERDERAAEGWGGDRLRVYRDPAGQTSVVWFTVWDDEGEAREAEVAARAVAGEPAQQVTRAGRALLIVRDLPASLRAPVDLAFRAFAAPYATAP